MLAKNPGNKMRKKAVGVDLSDYEQLRLELEENHASQVKFLSEKHQWRR